MGWVSKSLAFKMSMPGFLFLTFLYMSPRAVAQTIVSLRQAQGERWYLEIARTFSSMLSLSKHKIDLGNSPSTLGT